MVVLGTIDIESSLLNTDDLIHTGCESAREFGEELAYQLLICVRGRMRPFSRMELLGSLLDPELKNIPQIATELPCDDVGKFLVNAIEEYVPESLREEESPIVLESPSKKQRSSLIAKYASAMTPKENASSEVSRYLGLQVKFPGVAEGEEDKNLLSWWRRNAPAFPSISELARLILSISATSAEPERRFSAAGNALRVKRCTLSPLTMTKTLFIHDNKHILSKHQ